MKGLVFTELIEMVESQLGDDVADRMITQAETSTDGAYTAVGTYDSAELLRMVGALSNETATPPGALVRAFGRHLFSSLHKAYPKFFEGVTSAVEFLPMVESYIHVEVRKLYPDAELPTFDCATIGDEFVMTYESKRPFADLAEGMVCACVDHFGDSVEIRREDLGMQDGTEARFTLTPVSVVETLNVE